jgi:hypothetical protein
MSAEWRSKQRKLHEKLEVAEFEAKSKMTTLMNGLKYQRRKVNSAADQVTQLRGALRQYEKVNAMPEL